MPGTDFSRFDPTRVSTPCYVIDEVTIERNLALLKHVADASGARFLLALKAFALWRLAPLVSRYISGVCASGLYEARLGREEYEGELHVYSVAFGPEELEEILTLADHVVFNSLSQFERYADQIDRAALEQSSLQFGIRINPQYSEGLVPIYDPCIVGSRLGIPRAGLDGKSLEGLSGLHFHTLCEQGAGTLERTLEVIERDFAPLLRHVDWVNLGGGHLVTDSGYETGRLVDLLRNFSEKHEVRLYLEPGAAVAWEAGVLVTEVGDIGWNETDQVIVDTSVPCHMPDVLEMPYRPEILGAGTAGEYPHRYRIGGRSCLAGDVIGDYSFPDALRVGDRLVITDMAHYTMVRTSTFNGVPLPSIAIWNSTTDELDVIREFGYEEFKGRLS